MEAKRGEEVKKRALNLIKKIKFRKGLEKKRDQGKRGGPIYIRKRIREEKETAEAGARENSRLEESTDSDFIITYERVPGSPEPEQDREEERAMLDVDTSEDSASPGSRNDEEEPSGGKAPRLSPKQRHRRQSLARFKRKQWGEEWLV